MTQLADSSQEPVYQGQFGEFTITESDRLGVIVYRSCLMVAALCFAAGSALVLWQGNNRAILQGLTPLYACFCFALAVALTTIHIYMASLHRALQLFWAIGAVAALVLAIKNPEPLVFTVYNNPGTILGVGFTFAALTGIYFKEAFCFDRLETKFLTPLVPLLLLGHLAGILPVSFERFLLIAWATLFLIFGLRKLVQDIPADIGDKSVFEYLKKGNS